MQSFFFGLIGMIVLASIAGFVMSGANQPTTDQSLDLQSVHLGSG